MALLYFMYARLCIMYIQVMYEYLNQLCQSFFRVPYFKRKKRNPYNITLLSVRPSVCQERFSQERVEVSNWNLYMILRSTVPGSCRKINLLSQRNQKIQPFRPQISANFRNSHGNQNLQGTSRELRILKFRTKSRHIVQI